LIDRTPGRGMDASVVENAPNQKEVDGKVSSSIFGAFPIDEQPKTFSFSVDGYNGGVRKAIEQHWTAAHYDISGGDSGHGRGGRGAAPCQQSLPLEVSRFFSGSAAATAHICDLWSQSHGGAPGACGQCAAQVWL